MPKYEVKVTQKEIYWMNIEAENEAEAKEKASELASGEDKHKYHDDSDCDIEAYGY